MKRFVLCLVALMLPVAAFAQADGNANINVVVTLPDYAGCAAGLPFEELTCEDLVSGTVEGTAFSWIFMSDGDMYPDGIGGIQFGVDYTKTVIGWTLCTGGSEIPEDGWPNTGTGNAATWAGGCYFPAGENALVGFFTVADGASGAMNVTMDPRIGMAMWSDCQPFSQEFYPELLGGVDNAAPGPPNCDEFVVPTIESSWGQIKASY
jgi:hypothetical protein